MSILKSGVCHGVAISVGFAVGCSGVDEAWVVDSAGGFGGMGSSGGSGEVAGSGGADGLEGYRFRTGANGFEVSIDGATYRPFWPIGVNYGHGIPGTSAGEFAATREQIAEFIQTIGDLGANSIRVYTVQSPLFYDELRRYNESNPDKPLFLLQGAWLREPNEDADFAGMASYDSPWIREQFTDEMQKVVDVVHGNRDIPPGSPGHPLNYGRAYGHYGADVSPWLLGWLIGREMEPPTIQGTNEFYYAAHCGGSPCFAEFNGNFFSIAKATPSEVAVTRWLDFVAAYEAEHYNAAHPMAFSNWPTLDPIDHVVELGFDDQEVLDLRKIIVSPTFTPGIFYSYHAYPYYPEFILHEPSFQVDDEIGPNSYLGYLDQLRTEYAGRTLIIAEIGLPSSQGSAHFAASGMSHGGLDEREQGAAILRSLRTITRSQLNGAFIFEALDEWWKRAWVVERLELPGDRRPLWFNALSPEQNFGLLAMRPGSDERHHEIDGLSMDFPDVPSAEQDAQLLAPLDEHDPLRTLRALTIDSDEGFLHLLLRVESLDPDGDSRVDWDHVDYLVGIDTLDPDRGDRCFEPSCRVQTERRIEFLLRVNSENEVTHSVDRPYDLVGVWHGFREPWQLYRTVPNDAGVFDLMRTVTNDAFWYAGQELAPIIYQNIGQFRTGTELKTSNTNFWYSIAENALELRIPWTLLHVTDPSQRMVVDDDVPGKKDAAQELQVRQTPEFAVVVVTLDGAGAIADTLPRAKQVGNAWVIPAMGAPVYTWKTWDADPRYHMYRKQSFGIVQQALSGVVPESAWITP